MNSKKENRKMTIIITKINTFFLKTDNYFQQITDLTTISNLSLSIKARKAVL